LTGSTTASTEDHPSALPAALVTMVPASPSSGVERLREPLCLHQHHGEAAHHTGPPVLPGPGGRELCATEAGATFAVIPRSSCSPSPSATSCRDRDERHQGVEGRPHLAALSAAGRGLWIRDRSRPRDRRLRGSRNGDRPCRPRPARRAPPPRQRDPRRPGRVDPRARVLRRRAFVGRIPRRSTAIS